MNSSSLYTLLLKTNNLSIVNEKQIDNIIKDLEIIKNTIKKINKDISINEDNSINDKILEENINKVNYMHPIVENLDENLILI